ncbi:IPT/TIG domain-containing protein [bacterium]|nr:IPT/TIG domain-containing protein [bacterium]
MKSIIKTGLIFTALLLVVAGCDTWDGPTAMYYRDQPDYPEATITGITPEVAAAGENYITIQGENFAPALSDNQVFFGNALVDLVDGTASSLIVRRPNAYGDNITVKVVSYGTLVVAEFPAYKVTRVVEPYGNILAGNDPIALAVDQDENVIVMLRQAGVGTSAVQKFTPDGQRIDVGTVPVFAGDARIAPNGKMTFVRDNNKIIRQLDLSTGVSDTLITVSKNVASLDYDANGVLYAGGNKSDLLIIPPDLTEIKPVLYAKDQIFSVRVSNGYVYLLAGMASPNETTPELGIFRHQIMDAAGTLGPREVVLDWAATGDFSEFAPAAFAFSASGTLYVGSDAMNPLLKINPDGSMDVMYKTIVSSSILDMAWGNGDYLYYIKGPYGDDDTSVLMRIDMGEAGIK